MLSAPSTWSGNLTSATADSANSGIVRLSHSEALGPIGTAKDISMLGYNRAIATVELTGGIAIDDTKTLKLRGKSFYNAGDANVGSPVILSNLSGNNTWAGSVLIVDGGGGQSIESQAGTLTLGADSTTTKVIRNDKDATRQIDFRGAGDIVLNLQVVDNTDKNTGFTMFGTGTLTVGRSDNTFDQGLSLVRGTVVVPKLADTGTASSLGVGPATGSSIRIGGTLRYTGGGDSSNRPLGFYASGATLDSSGSGPLLLTAPTFSHEAGTTSTVARGFAAGATVLTLNESGGINPGQTISEATNTLIATGTTVTAVDPVARTVTLSQPTLLATTNSITVNIGGVTSLDRTLTLTGSNADDNTFAANLTNPGGTGKLGITKTGSGKWVLPGATKSYAGPTNVLAGTLEISNSFPTATSLTVDPSATLALDSVTLNYTGLPVLDIAGALDFTGPVKIVVPASSTVPGTFTSVLEYGSLTGVANLTSDYRNGSFTDAGTSATLDVAAGIALTWTGATNGNWDVDTTANWQDALANPEMFYWLDSVTFNETGSATQPTVTLTQEVRPLQVTVSEPSVNYSFIGTGFISGTASLTKSGDAKLTIATNNTNSGDTTIQAGTVEVGTGATSGAIGTGNVKNDAILAFNRSNTYQYDGSISGSGSITQIGFGTTILTADQSYAGTTTVGAGTLRIGNRTATGKLGAGAVVNDAILQISRSDNTYVVANDISGIGSLQIGINGVALPAAEWDSLVTLTGNNTFTGGITVNSGGLLIQSVAALGTGPKTITLTNGTNGRPQFYLDGSGGDLTLPADFSFTTSSTQFTHPAIGNLVGDNVIEGTLSLTSGGGDTVVSVLGGTLALNGGISNITTNRELKLAGNVGTTGTINGLIADGADAFRVSKSEAGTWMLTNANTYTGTTVVNGGTLLINGDQTAATGAVTVRTTATLGGIGKVGGALTVNAGGTLAPGESVGTLTTAANATIDGTLAIEIDDTTTDKLVVGGTLDIGGSTLTVTPTGAGLTLPAYIIAEANAPIVGNFAATNLPPGYIVVVGYDDGVDTNNIAVVQGVADTYLAWADDNFLVGANRAPDADPDNDGLENGIEFVIGSDPNAATGTGKPEATVSGGNLVFTFKRSDASEAFDVFVEHSTNLQAPWTSILVPVGAVTGPPVDVVEVDPGLDTVTVTIPMGTDLRKFARLRADIPFTP